MLRVLDGVGWLLNTKDFCEDDDAASKPAVAGPVTAHLPH